jgi:hypothetical protein
MTRVTTLIAAGALGVSTLGIVSCDPPPPSNVVYGDSLAVLAQTASPTADTDYHVYGGTNICDWRGDFAERAKTNPKRVVLVFTGNTWKEPVATAYRVYGVDGAAKVQAGCIREARAAFPLTTQIVVMSTLACNTGWANGDPAYNLRWKEAVVPSSNMRWRTYTDDTFTPGHVFRNWKRDPDGIHLTTTGTATNPSGAQVYADQMRRAIIEP